MSVRVARIIAGLSVFALVTRMLALVSRLVTVRATLPKGSAHRGVSGTARGDALTPVPNAYGAREPASTPPVQPERSNARALVAASLLALELLAVLAAFLAPAPVRAVLIFAAMVALPGAAITTRLTLGDALTTIGLTVAIGMTVDVVAGLALVWTGWWHPVAAAAIVGGASTASLLPQLRHAVSLNSLRVSHPPRPLLALLPAIASLVFWVLSLHSNADLVHLRNIGLPVGLPVAWYLALVIALVGAVVMIASHKPHGLVLAVYVGIVVLIIYGTLPALAHEPPYSWTYKHIGVTSLIEQTGTVHPGVDIYNRWPGFFAAAAAFARLAGLAPLSFAAWFEPLFVALDALLVAALGLAVSGRTRVAAWAALLFTVANYVGQDYYSPQALAFLLSLAGLVLVVRQLTDPDALRGWIRAAIARVSPAEPPDPSIGSLPLPRAASIALILALQAAIVATHQLTPYVLAAQVGMLTVLGVTRPRWLVGVLALMAVGYLLPNLSFVRHHFALFTGFDPFGNAKVATFGGGQPWAVVNGGGIISKLLIGIGLLGSLRLLRLGHGRTLAVPVTLAAVPIVVLFGQSYGGEAALRVFLFSTPWLVILAAWGLVTIRATWRRILAGGAAVAALTVMLLPAFLGRAPVIVMPPGELAAANYFYAHAPAGSVLTPAGPDFPTRLDPRYAVMADPEQDVDLMLYPALQGHRLGAADIPNVIAFMRLHPGSNLLVFGSTEDRYAVASGLLPPGSLASLERAVAHSSQFRLWYHNREAAIYQLVKP